MKKSSGWMIAVVAFLIPVLYVASFGPACWLADREFIPLKAAEQVYKPLATASVRVGISKCLRKYGELLETPQPQPPTSRFGHGNWRMSCASSILLSALVDEAIH